MNSKNLIGFILIVSVLYVNGKTKLLNEEGRLGAKVRHKRAPTTQPPGGEQEIEVEETTAAPTTTTKAAPTLAPYPRQHQYNYQRPSPPAQPTIQTISYRNQQYLGKNPTNSQVWPGTGRDNGHSAPQQQQQQNQQWPPRAQPTQWPGPSYRQPTSFSASRRMPSPSFSAPVAPTLPVRPRNDHLTRLGIGRSLPRSQRQTFNSLINNHNRGPRQLHPLKQKVGSNCPTFQYTTRNNMVELHTVPGQCKIAIEFPPPGYYGHAKVRYFAKMP